MSRPDTGPETVAVGSLGTAASSAKKSADANDEAAGDTAAPVAVPAPTPTPSATPNAATSPSRSEEHTSELQSLMRISYAVFCLTKKINNKSSLALHHLNPSSTLTNT